MPLVKPDPFYRNNIEQIKDTFTVKYDLDLTKEKMKFYMELINQPKPSTCLKQLAEIGAEVVLEQKMSKILSIVVNNFRKNKRTGIIKFEKFEQK